MRVLPVLAVVALLAFPGPGVDRNGLRAQSPGDPVEPTLPPSRDTAPKPEGEDEGEDESEPTLHPIDEFIPESDRPWGLVETLSGALADTARTYRDYALRFVCRETVRAARYDSMGEASKEELRLYEYLLERNPAGGLREYRQRVKRSGELAPGKQIEDDEGFPPAYGWAFLFSPFNQQYFNYRLLGEQFEGFDFVKVIQFKGALPFTDGKDIRQWEGIAVVDAHTHTPLEIRAEPSGQRERIKVLYDQWSRSFNLFGIRLAPRPVGYRCTVHFRMRRDGLSFPTELRYDTFQAVSKSGVIPLEASIRQYRAYRFTKVETEDFPTETRSPDS